MYAYKQISKVYHSAKIIPFHNYSQIVIMSDCHRGDGSWSDNFAKNQNLFLAALNKYNIYNYTYIELGDGDELWENKKISDIIDAYKAVFWLMSRFYKNDRFHSIFGNHDIVKRHPNYAKNNLFSYFDTRGKKEIPLFPNIKIEEGLILKNIDTGYEIFLLHGHQADLLNDTLWRVNRFLVRYFWKPLELIGVNDPTSASKNYKRKKWVEKKLINWVKRENKILIAGHTHRSIMPKPGEPLYFNSGSCVHPRCITAIEILMGTILLVKWSYKTRIDGTVYVGRDVLEGPIKLQDYYQQSQ